MATVVLSAFNVANAPSAGGHFWVYMQYAQGLMRSGCEVYWLERLQSTGDRDRDAAILTDFRHRLERYGLGRRVVFYVQHTGAGCGRYEFLNMSQSSGEAIFRCADLLLNFNYTIEPELLSRFRRTAVVDIDPGLLQFWIATGQIVVPDHHAYFTTGETTGLTPAFFPDCGILWLHIRPPVSLEQWPAMPDGGCRAFTTISSWWGGAGRGEFVTDGRKIFFENNKRVTFLDFVDLPRRTTQPLELALSMGEGDPLDADCQAERGAPPLGVPASREPDRHPYVSDAEDRRLLESYGWRIRLAQEVARTPEMYRSYIQRSRGEFSCAKPSCMKFQNAWVSDRTLCYMASGKPVVVQNTGPSACLPNGEGMFRFTAVEEAVEALDAINANYAHHCRAARELVEARFDSKKVAEKILNSALTIEARAASPTQASRFATGDQNAA